MSPPSLNHLNNDDKFYITEPKSNPQIDSSQEPNLHNRKQLGQKGVKYFTKEEVLQHDKEDDCWLIVSGSVYDVTRWLARHPGKHTEVIVIFNCNSMIKCNKI